ncbi:MAG: sulfotransferase domain-containing protein [Rhizobiales bacterium]|nr:sulfotransferase domain-containing protein [Hyphomicrobiales bacterium]
MGALIWLASYPKSGNTWLRSYLHNLLRNTVEPHDINEIDHFCLGESYIKWYDRLTDRPLNEMTPLELAALRPEGQVGFTKVFPDSVFVKTHNFLGEWLGYPLHNMDVTAGGIYVLRNPLDVVLSMTHHFGMTIDEAIYRLGNEKSATGLTETHMPEIHSSWSTHVRSWTQHPNPQLLVLRYEDMINEPLKYFTQVANFLGLKPSQERIERAIRNSSFKTLKEQEQKTGFKEKSEHAQSFFREGKVDQWREKLTPSQIRQIIVEHREQMQRFGYIPADFA